MRALFFIPLVLQFVFGACVSKTNQQSSSLSGAMMKVTALNVPVLVEKNENRILKLIVNEENTGKSLKSVKLYFTQQSLINDLEEIEITYLDNEEEKVFGSSIVEHQSTTIIGSKVLDTGMNSFSISLNVKNTIDISRRVALERVECTYGDGQMYQQSFEDDECEWRIGNVVRAANQDNCDTYRIPGMITTNAGTLIAVYDNRYNNSKDLQEDIDVGMSRSTNGGQTWEPMKVIMDQGEWGGLSQQLNGVGDPCVLYDYHTNTIWVAALWLHGSEPKKMAWWDSDPGIKPGETGQFLVAKSTDDGLTWSETMNITEQIKDPAWQLLLQGPGRGITLEDGTLVFPAQFKADIGEKALDGGPYTCHSTIVYSKDQGKTWKIGTGAKSNTTEAQVAILSDGSLMLNMRDDRNRKDKTETNGRAVSITKDLGQSWERHVTSNSSLQESNCMASLISAPLQIMGETKHVIFFSNPNNKHKRTNMTIKASLDDGMTWPYELELNETGGFGYSCLSMVDNETIGILYEGTKELYFQKVEVSEILKSQN
ncbi:MAG: exo-alpha-sialidase [Marinilabiliaceae bacterium]|nr:exo-alpha-sialidase [Marinilabiliaceae bacterium]